MPVRSRLRVHLNRKSFDFQGFAIFLLDFAPREIRRLQESCRVSSAFLLENCSRYPLFSGYQEQFRYVFALGKFGKSVRGTNCTRHGNHRKYDYFIGYSQIESSHPKIDAAILCSVIYVSSSPLNGYLSINTLNLSQLMSYK